jgi:hypothetical protein
MKTTSYGPIVLTGAAGKLGAVMRIVTGRSAMSVRKIVSLRAEEFRGLRSINKTANTTI